MARREVDRRVTGVRRMGGLAGTTKTLRGHSQELIRILSLAAPRSKGAHVILAGPLTRLHAGQNGRDFALHNGHKESDGC
jgi:hypothetical protein